KQTVHFRRGQHRPAGRIHNRLCSVRPLRRFPCQGTDDHSGMIQKEAAAEIPLRLLSLTQFQASCFLISALKSGRSSGERLVTILLHTTTDASCTLAPAFSRSFLPERNDVMLRSVRRSVSIST